LGRAPSFFPPFFFFFSPCLGLFDFPLGPWEQDLPTGGRSLFSLISMRATRRIRFSFQSTTFFRLPSPPSTLRGETYPPLPFSSLRPRYFALPFFFLVFFFWSFKFGAAVSPTMFFCEFFVLGFFYPRFKCLFFPFLTPSFVPFCLSNHRQLPFPVGLLLFPSFGCFPRPPLNCRRRAVFFPPFRSLTPF